MADYLDERKIIVSKDYSKDFCKVSLTIETTSGDLANATTLIDNYLFHELAKIPDGGFTKDRQPKTTSYASKPNYNSPSEPSQPTNTNATFGSAKQWDIVRNPKNLGKLNAAGYSPENIDSYEALQAAMKVIFKK